MKEMGRERLGPPKPGKVLKSKKKKRLDKAIAKEVNDEFVKWLDEKLK